MFASSPEYFRSLDSFIERLKSLSFLTVERVVVKREDLLAFRTKEGTVVEFNEPWFGSEWGKLTKEEQGRAEAHYAYYYGFAGGAHFRGSSRMGARVCFLPLQFNASKFIYPRVGDLLMGDVHEEDGKKHFLSWAIAGKQDKLFADIFCGRVTVSEGKLRQKLAVPTVRGEDYTLYYLCRALLHSDSQCFIDLAFKDRRTQVQELGMPLQEWLNRNILWARPDIVSIVLNELSD